MSLIDSTYFIREIDLPSTAISGTKEDLATFITQYEKEVLIDLLGYELYKDFIANSGDTRWTRLTNGYEYQEDYQDGTTTVKWNGLINTDLISLIAYYVYFYYAKFHATRTSRVGESIDLSENANMTTWTPKMVNAWNEFVGLYGKQGDSVINPTAYNFLKKFEDDATNGYEGWIFTDHIKTNTFGL
jgi:hypothetical protein